MHHYLIFIAQDMGLGHITIVKFNTECLRDHMDRWIVDD